MLAIELVRRVYQALQRKLRRHRTRQQLLRLDQHMLDDIGLSSEQARAEALKPFWR